MTDRIFLAVESDHDLFEIAAAFPTEEEAQKAADMAKAAWGRKIGREPASHFTTYDYGFYKTAAEWWEAEHAEQEDT